MTDSCANGGANLVHDLEEQKLFEVQGENILFSSTCTLKSGGEQCVALKCNCSRT